MFFNSGLHRWQLAGKTNVYGNSYTSGYSEHELMSNEWSQPSHTDSYSLAPQVHSGLKPPAEAGTTFNFINSVWTKSLVDLIK